jgi:hypothetical protein
MTRCRPARGFSRAARGGLHAGKLDGGYPARAAPRRGERGAADPFGRPPLRGRSPHSGERRRRLARWHGCRCCEGHPDHDERRMRPAGGKGDGGQVHSSKAWVGTPRTLLDAGVPVERRRRAPASAWQSGHRQRPEGCLLLVCGRHQIDIDRECRVCLIATATVLELPPIGARTRRRRAYAPDATRAAKWRFRWSSQAATRSRTTTATTRAGEAGATSLLCAQIREARRSRRERASRRRRSLRAAPAPSRQTCSGSRRVHEES